ncbi:MAG TPA: hypothetical protein VKQ29_09535 [Aliidongia sp.]|nr:hypothetical protein [Aliidongia sp.]
MSTKNICLALVAVALTAGIGTVASAHRNLLQPVAATAPATCTTEYSTQIGADGRSVSVASLTCSRSAQRLASGAAL